MNTPRRPLMDQTIETHHEEPGATLSRTARILLGGSAAVATAVAYGLLARVLAEEFDGAMATLGGAVLLPLAMGALGAELSTGILRRSIPLRSTIGLIAGILYLAVIVFTGLNGPLYTLALLPATLVAAPGGGALSGLLLHRVVRQHSRLLALAAVAGVPIVLMALEATFPPTQTGGALVVRQEIAADHHTVWTTLLNIDTIADEEPQTILQQFGLPRFTAARMIGEGRDAVRLVTFENGIDYEEIVTQWTPPDTMRFTVAMDPEWIPAGAVDPHLRLGGEQFDLGEGFYAIDSLGPKRTRLTMGQQFRLRTTLAPYLAWWTRVAISDAQHSAMDVVRRRAERTAARD